MSMRNKMCVVAVCALCMPGCLSTDTADVAESVAESRARRVAQIAAARSDGAAASGDSATTQALLPVIEGELSVEDAVKLAMANNLALKVAYISRREADGAILQAYAGALPKANLSGDAGAELSESDSDAYSLGVRVTQPLWRGGAVGAGLRYAKLYAFSTDASIRAKVQETVYNARLMYMDVLLARHMTEVYEAAVAQSERMLDRVTKEQLRGAARNYDVVRAEVELAGNTAELIKAKNALQVAKVALFQIMGVSQNSEVTFADKLAYTAEEYRVDDAFDVAMMQRPDLAIAEANIRMAEEQIKVVRADYMPSADAFVSGAYANPDPGGESGNDDWGDEWRVGASVTFKLFDGFERKGKLMQAQAKLNSAVATLRDAEEAAHVDIVTSILQLKHADELYQSQRKNIEMTELALKMLEDGNRHGKNTQIEVLDAHAALTEAQGAYYDAVHAHNKARLYIQKAMGTIEAP